MEIKQQSPLPSGSKTDLTLTRLILFLQHKLLFGSSVWNLSDYCGYLDLISS